MLLECGCGKMYRVRDGATNPPKNCPACGGLLKVAGGAAPAPAAAPAAPPAADPKAKDLEARVQALERENSAAKAAVELKDKELREARESVAKLSGELEKAKETLSKKDAELSERSAQTTKLLLSKDEALREAQEKIESLEGQGGGAAGNAESLEQELADLRKGKEVLIKEVATIEGAYKDKLKTKELELEDLQQRLKTLEKAGAGKADTPEGQRFQARIGALEKIVQDGEQRYRSLQRELEETQRARDEARGGAESSGAEMTRAISERDEKIKSLEAGLQRAREDLAGAKAAPAPPAAPSGIAADRLGEIRYLSADLDRGLASISTALNGLVNRVRRLNETVQEIPESAPAAAEAPPAEEAPADLPLVEPPPADPDAPPDLPATPAEEPTPVDVPQLESIPAPDVETSSLPDDGTLLDMGGVNRQASAEPEPEPVPADVAPETEPEPAPEPEQKKGFFGKLFGGKKKQRPAF
jgi:hypothetical protein